MAFFTVDYNNSQRPARASSVGHWLHARCNLIDIVAGIFAAMRSSCFKLRICPSMRCQAWFFLDLSCAAHFSERHVKLLTRIQFRDCLIA